MECVILAAGEGKRMRPLTTSRPKVMLPLANRPMLEHLMNSAIKAGITDFIFVVGYHEEAVRDYFGDGSEFGANIRYTVQRSQRGTADALNAVKGLVSDDFLLLNGDMVMNAEDISGLSGAVSPCMGVFKSSHPQDYGVITTEGRRVTGIFEKTSEPKGDLINAGAYLLEPGIFGILSNLELSERGEFELTDALMEYVSTGNLTTYALSEWGDVGEPWNLLDANAAMLENLEGNIEGEVEDFVVLKGAVSLGKGSTIRSGTYIEGPCVIGENCTVGPHAYIRGATSIGDNCHVGHSSELKNSVILPDTKIPHFNYIGDSVIGSKCNFGAGSKIANLRHDKKDIMAGDRNTKRRKFGAVVGDGVLFGINSSVNPGAIIGSGAAIAPCTLVEGKISDNTKYGR